MLIKGIKRTLRRFSPIDRCVSAYMRRDGCATSPDYDLQIYDLNAKLLDEHASGFRDRVILDVGCGDNCLHAFKFLAAGAREVVLCEITADQCLSEQMMQKRFDEKKDLLQGMDYKTLCSNIRIVTDPVERLTGIADESIDIIISTSLLEHVYDLEAAFAEMRRVLAPQGCMVHSVDLRDHFFFDHPLHFLRYAPWWWRNFYTRPSTYTNRHRAPRYFGLLEKYGFEVLYHKTDSTDHPLKQFGVHPCFSGYSEEELRTVYLLFAARK